jgi:hypothetical protein
MQPEYLLIVLAAILFVGCGARRGDNEARISPDFSPRPAQQESEPEGKVPVYGLPLDIRVDAPQAPEEIQRPSPPIPPDTPMPGLFNLDSAFWGKEKNK